MLQFNCNNGRVSAIMERGKLELKRTTFYKLVNQFESEGADE